MVRVRSSRAKSPNESPVKQFGSSGRRAELGPNEETKDSEINESQKAPESEGRMLSWPRLLPTMAGRGQSHPPRNGRRLMAQPNDSSWSARCSLASRWGRHRASGHHPERAWPRSQTFKRMGSGSFGWARDRSDFLVSVSHNGVWAAN
jgi:hypothetical protein